VSWKDRRTNNWVLERIGSELTIRNTIRDRKLRYFGHVMRKENSIEKQLIQGTVEGRPITAWTDDIKKWTGGSMEAATHMAEDRDRWRILIRATAAPIGAI